jgi:hypothetical protein
VGGNSDKGTYLDFDNSEADAKTQIGFSYGARIVQDPVLLYSSDGLVSFSDALTASQEVEEASDAAIDVAAAESATTDIETTVTSATEAPSPAPAPSPVVAAKPAGAVIYGYATAYGPSYNGQVLGCGTGYYASDDPTIMAVGPSRYADWPCGTQIQVCGPAGCIVVTRQDGCPGCYANLVDLSEAANAAVCGAPPNTCRVTLQVVGLP